MVWVSVAPLFKSMFYSLLLGSEGTWGSCLALVSWAASLSANTFTGGGGGGGRWPHEDNRPLRTAHSGKEGAGRRGRGSVM